MTQPGPGEPEVHRITQAPVAHSDDLETRMGRYLLSMLIRTVCVVLVIVVPGTLPRLVFGAGAVFLPYVAVILANAGGRRRDGAPATLAVRRELPPVVRHQDDRAQGPIEGVVGDRP